MRKMCGRLVRAMDPVRTVWILMCVGIVAGTQVAAALMTAAGAAQGAEQAAAMSAAMSAAGWQTAAFLLLLDSLFGLGDRLRFAVVVALSGMWLTLVLLLPPLADWRFGAFVVVLLGPWVTMPGAWIARTGARAGQAAAALRSAIRGP